MRPQPSEYVQTAMDVLGLTKTELGDALGKRNPYQTVHGWIVGRKKLEFDDTLAIAELCGWLNYPGGGASMDEAGFSRTMMGQIVRLLDREPRLLRHHDDLLRAGAAELRALAFRMEEAAEGRNDGSLPS